MEVRMLNTDDYDQSLKPWWESWGWSAPSKDFLPEDGIGGLMVSYEGVDICAGFIYFTNSKAAWIEFVISNKEYKGDNRKEALQLLINCLSSVAEDKKFKYIYTSLKSNSLIKIYSDCGFTKGDSNCQEMIKVL
jgi:hypothetical protein